MEKTAGMVSTAPAIPRDLSDSQEHWVWESEEEEGSLGKRSTEGCPTVVTHIRLVPETRDAEGLQQVTATEQ